MGVGVFASALGAPRPAIVLELAEATYTATRCTGTLKDVWLGATVPWEAQEYVALVGSTSTGTTTIEILRRDGCSKFTASRRVMRSRCSLVWVALAAAVCVQVGCDNGDPTPCASAAACWNAQESKDLGRCAPREVACVNGTCRARCGNSCQVVEATTNPCQEAGLICNQSSSGKEDFTYCTATPIACENASDCPVYRPASADAATAEWTCEQGTCRYPGFVYKWADL